MTNATSTLHPAAQWAIEIGFNAEQVDCTTTVVLKILDNKCKMLPGEIAAVMAIYDALWGTPAPLFDDAVHEAIKNMRLHSGTEAQKAVHRFRVQAEAAIPKPVMKRYKAFLHDGLFG
jgi:hypothetical protein